jgi:glutamate synthase (NADPH/NADH) small chain
MIETLGVELDKRGNVLADTENYTSNVEKVFACGDMRRGQSLVVWAIREGRQCARAIDGYLMGETTLPR